MKRTQIYISEHLQEKLERASKERRSSKSEIIREAITEYFERHSESERARKLQKGAGMWKNKKEIPDLLQLRDEMNRTF
ncbi:MAG: CopG family transcriptional regulator [Balneolaceae bacterium]